MRKLNLLFILLFFCGCSNDSENVIKPKWSYALWGNDTVNKTDKEGRKQGIWHTFDHSESGAQIVIDTILYRDDKEISK